MLTYGASCWNKAVGLTTGDGAVIVAGAVDGSASFADTASAVVAGVSELGSSPVSFCLFFFFFSDFGVVASNGLYNWLLLCCRRL